MHVEVHFVIKIEYYNFLAPNCPERNGDAAREGSAPTLTQIAARCLHRCVIHEPLPAEGRWRGTKLVTGCNRFLPDQASTCEKLHHAAIFAEISSYLLQTSRTYKFSVPWSLYNRVLLLVIER